MNQNNEPGIIEIIEKTIIAFNSSIKIENANITANMILDALELYDYEITKIK